MSDCDIVVIGAGAAGIAAARRLLAAGRKVRVVEARNRVGGRAWTVHEGGVAIDLGCGWLHSAQQNEWAELARKLDFAIDASTPAWSKPALERGFPADQQIEFRAALDALFERVEEFGDRQPDRPAADLLPQAARWRDLIDAVSTWINGAELDKVSAQDFSRYADTGVNWRVADGYGTLIAAAARGVDIVCDCAATAIDHSGSSVKVATTRGTLAARCAIVTLSTDVLAAGMLSFSPALPDKLAAATALPLGLADKLFMRVTNPGDLPVERRLYGALDGEIASFHLRPFGSDLIEVYVGGALAHRLEKEDGAMFAFASDQIVRQLGSDMRKRLSFVAASAWARDPLARGSYSYARIGMSDQRAVLATPVDGRLFFAGEATSKHDFSTAHGAYRSGVRAAEEALAALKTRT